MKQVLRAELEARGVTWETVTAILGHPAVSLGPSGPLGCRGKPAGASVVRMTGMRGASETHDA